MPTASTWTGSRASLCTRIVQVAQSSRRVTASSTRTGPTITLDAAASGDSCSVSLGSVGSPSRDRTTTRVAVSVPAWDGARAGTEDMGASVYRRRFADRLADPRPILLDGALGTELERRGIGTALPLWSAHALLAAPDVVARIHAEYADAGAEVLTANTFRTQARTLARAGIGDRARELTALAIELARSAAGDDRWVAGSLATLEDCWHPERTPDAAALEAEHGEHAANLCDAGVDLLLVETMNTIREAVAATRAARATGAPTWVSFACDERAQLLSGEPLSEAIAAVAALDPILVGVNCMPAAYVATALPALRACGRPFGVYANLGAPRPDGGRAHDATPIELAASARGWIDAGARAVGGCCGTTPEHVRAIARAIESGAR